MSDEGETFRKRAEARFEESDAKVARLLSRTGKAGAGGRIELRERLEDLRARRDVARRRLARLRDSGGEAWIQLKDGMIQALNDLEVAAGTLERRLGAEERLERARKP